MAPQLEHTNIVRIYGICLDDKESVSLLMELVPGGSLRAMLDRDAAAITHSSEAQFDLLDGIVSGMAYLHTRTPGPILHHDLKSENVLLLLHDAGGPGERFCAKIADFGLASGAGGSMNSTDASKMRTSQRTNGGAGTLAYKAPELYRNAPYTAACEVFAFGIIAFELASGGRPWQGMNEASLLMALVVEKKRPELSDAQVTLSTNSLCRDECS